MPATTPVSSTDPTTSVNGITLAGVSGKTLTVNNNLTLKGADGSTLPSILQQTGLPLGLPPSGFMQADGTFIIGQAPSSSATVSFSATSGAGVTMTFSAATLLGTAVDVGRVLTILDTTFKYAVITAQVSTTVATVTLTGTLSGTGPFANNTIWLSGGISTNAASSNTTTFSVPFFFTYPNIYLFFPSTSPIGVAGMYFCQMQSTTVGKAFNNKLSVNTLPTVISSPTAFSGLTPAAFTQTIQTDLLTSVTVPANSMGVNGMLIVDVDSVYPNTAGSKTPAVVLGGSASIGATYSTTTSARWQPRISNNGVANSQVGSGNVTSFGTGGNGALALGRFAQDTTTDLSLKLQVTMTASTDFYVAEAYSMQLWPN